MKKRKKCDSKRRKNLLVIDPKKLKEGTSVIQSLGGQSYSICKKGNKISITPLQPKCDIKWRVRLFENKEPSFSDLTGRYYCSFCRIITSENHFKKKYESMYGNTNPMKRPKVKAKVSKALEGRKRPDVSKAKKGKPNPKVSEKLKGRKLSLIHREKIGNGEIGRAHV
jgi:hypothetical protein